MVICTCICTNLGLDSVQVQVMNAMKYVFGPFIVCDTSETAKHITFHPNVRVKTVTKEQIICNIHAVLAVAIESYSARPPYPGERGFGCKAEVCCLWSAFVRIQYVG